MKGSKMICPRHNGEWGSDSECVVCVDADGDVRGIPGDSYMETLKDDVYMLKIQVSAKSTLDAQLAFSELLDTAEMSEYTTDYAGGVSVGERLTNSDVRRGLDFDRVVSDIAVMGGESIAD